jgi:hypothetical protein
MRLSLALLVLVASCDMQKFTVNQTSPVLLSAQASLQQENDYDLAKAAVPGALKTVEGFWVVNPDNEELTQILTEGFCQYGAAFVDEDWEQANLEHWKQDKITELDIHATKVYTRCLNYALRQLGDRWKKEIYGNPATVAKLVADTGGDKRDAMMWAGVALGSIIQHNLRNSDAVSYQDTVQKIIGRVLELDKANKPSDLQKAALPHVVLAMLASAKPVAFGGDTKAAEDEFMAALAVTGDKFLLARALMAYRVGKMMKNDEKYFHDNLVKVLQTDPAIWPEQRLANEVAERKARRYLSHEKELF